MPLPLFYVIKTVNTHSFADDNTLTTFSNNIRNFIHLSGSQSSVTIKWFKGKKVIVNS